MGFVVVVGGGWEAIVGMPLKYVHAWLSVAKNIYSQEMKVG